MTQENSELVISQSFTAPAEEVFDAWFNPKQAAQFLFATPGGKMLQVDIDAHVGGRYRIIEQRGDIKAEHFGQYIEITRPARLVFTFAVPGFPETLVAIDISKLEQGCELTLTHTKVLPEYAERTQNGWKNILNTLAHTLT